MLLVQYVLSDEIKTRGLHKSRSILERANNDTLREKRLKKDDQPSVRHKAPLANICLSFIHFVSYWSVYDHYFADLACLGKHANNRSGQKADHPPFWALVRGHLVPNTRDFPPSCILLPRLHLLWFYQCMTALGPWDRQGCTCIESLVIGSKTEITFPSWGRLSALSPFFFSILPRSYWLLGRVIGDLFLRHA